MNNKPQKEKIMAKIIIVTDGGIVMDEIEDITEVPTKLGITAIWLEIEDALDNALEYEKKGIEIFN